MTITDEDRAFCEVVWSALKGDHNDLRRERMILHAHREHRQAAFNAGLERAVKAVQVELAMCALANDEAPSEWIDGFEFAWNRVNAAIRAEKEKV